MTNVIEPSVNQMGDLTVLKVAADRIDASNSREFKAKAIQLVQGHRKVLIDMQEVDFVDSTGLGALLSCLRACTATGGDLRLCRLAKPVRTLFELTRMHRAFHVHNTFEEALAAFQA